MPKRDAFRVPTRYYTGVKQPEPTPRPIRQNPVKVTENPTTLGDLVDRFLDRLDRMRVKYE